jgi:hypothetical protein
VNVTVEDVAYVFAGVDVVVVLLLWLYYCCCGCIVVVVVLVVDVLVDEFLF